MNAGDVKAGRTSSEEWLTAPSADPNAALWASITPPPSPNLATLIRRRLAALAPDLLAQRLYTGFPHYFSSPLAASRAVLAGVAALGAGVGLAAYLVAGALLAEPAETAAIDAAQASTSANASVRTGVTTDGAGQAAPEAGDPTPSAQNTLADAPAAALVNSATLANTAALEPEQLVQTLQPSAADERSQLTSSKAKKRAHARKKLKARTKPRAKAAAALDMEAPERSAPPPRARPRRQAAFKFN